MKKPMKCLVVEHGIPTFPTEFPNWENGFPVRGVKLGNTGKSKVIYIIIIYLRYSQPWEKPPLVLGKAPLFWRIPTFPVTHTPPPFIEALKGYLLLKWCYQKKTKKALKYLREHLPASGCLVQRSQSSLPLLTSSLDLLSVKINGVLDSFFNRCLCNIYFYLLSIYSLKGGAYHE